jgi:hypothetical protein
MKSFNVILLLAVIMISNSYSFQFSSLKEVQALKSSVFGSNLIETISLTFASGAKEDAGQEILTQLNELKDQLNKDQENDTQLFLTKENDFKNHIEKLAGEIENLSQEIQRLAEEIKRLSALIETANQNIESFNSRIINLVELKAKLEEDKKTDNEYYNAKIEELGKLYDAFTQIITKLNLMKGSVSGENKYSHIEATQSEIRDQAWAENNKNSQEIVVEEPKTQTESEVTPVFAQEKMKKFMSFLQVSNQNKEATNMAIKLAKQYTKFLETTVNADQSALEKLISILSGIQDETLAKKAATVEYLSEINAKYDTIKRNTEEEIATNQEALINQTQNRDKYVEEKAKNEEEKKMKEQRRDLLVNEKEINEKFLSELSGTNEKEKAERAEELKVVNILVSIVEKRLLGGSQ